MDVGRELGQNDIEDSVKKHLLLPKVFDVFSRGGHVFLLHV